MKKYRQQSAVKHRERQLKMRTSITKAAIVRTCSKAAIAAFRWRIQDGPLCACLSCHRHLSRLRNDLLCIEWDVKLY